MAKKKNRLTQASRADIRMSVAHQLGFDKFDGEHDCEWNDRTHYDEFDTLCGFTQEGVGTLRIIISDRNSLTWLIDARAHFWTHVWLPKYFISDVLEKEGYDPSQIFEYEIA